MTERIQPLRFPCTKASQDRRRPLPTNMLGALTQSLSRLCLMRYQRPRRLMSSRLCQLRARGTHLMKSFRASCDFISLPSWWSFTRKSTRIVSARESGQLCKHRDIVGLAETRAYGHLFGLVGCVNYWSVTRCDPDQSLFTGVQDLARAHLRWSALDRARLTLVPEDARRASATCRKVCGAICPAP